MALRIGNDYFRVPQVPQNAFKNTFLFPGSSVKLRTEEPIFIIHRGKAIVEFGLVIVDFYSPLSSIPSLPVELSAQYLLDLQFLFILVDFISETTASWGFLIRFPISLVNFSIRD